MIEDHGAQHRPGKIYRRFLCMRPGVFGPARVGERSKTVGAVPATPNSPRGSKIYVAAFGRRILPVIWPAALDGPVAPQVSSGTAIWKIHETVVIRQRSFY